MRDVHVESRCSLTLVFQVWPLPMVRATMPGLDIHEATRVSKNSSWLMGYACTMALLLAAFDSSARDRSGHAVAASPSARMVQGSFNSAADRSSFEKALARTIGAAFKIENPDDATEIGDGSPYDQFGYSLALDGDTALVGALYDYTVSGTRSGAVYVYVRTGAAWSRQAKLAADVGEDGDEFGYSLALDGDTALVGARSDDSAAASGLGSAYVFTRSGTHWSQQAKLVAGDGVIDDNFGTAVALSGDTALVGAAQGDAAVADTGAAYIYVRSGNSWTQQAKLPATDQSLFDNFGQSVALSIDTAVVGAPGDDDFFVGTDAGSVYVFTRSGSTWSQQAKLTGDNGSSSPQLGWAVALSGDTVLAGAPMEDSAAGTNAGAAYVFTRSGNSWSRQTKITTGDGAFAQFGYSVALLNNTALIGANLDNIVFFDEGAAYVFVRVGSIWNQQAKLTQNIDESFQEFGHSVALSGGTAMVGAPFNSTLAGNNAGSAYLYTGSSGWSRQAALIAGDGTTQDQFGVAVVVSGDTALVGSWLDDTVAPSAGSAYVFVRNGLTWDTQAKLTASDGAREDFLGFSLALLGDTALLGAYGDDTAAGVNAGSVYVFTRSGDAWSERAKLTASDGAAEDYFGVSVALSGTSALIGAVLDDAPAGNESGSAYVFIGSDDNWSQQAKLTAQDAASDDRFGFAVAIHEDIALIGAYLDDTPGGINAGSSYVFVRENGLWSQQAQLRAVTAAVNDEFGSTVALYDETALIGAAGTDTALGQNSGAAYLFTRNGNNWAQQSRLTPGDAAPDERFGSSVALIGDTALVGARDGSTAIASEAGSAYIFARDGVTWQEQAKLIGGDGAFSDWFGWDVALSDGWVLIGARRDDSARSGNDNVGSAYMFDIAFLFADGFE